MRRGLCCRRERKENKAHALIPASWHVLKHIHLEMERYFIFKYFILLGVFYLKKPSHSYAADTLACVPGLQTAPDHVASARAGDGPHTPSVANEALAGSRAGRAESGGGGSGREGERVTPGQPRAPRPPPVGGRGGSGLGAATLWAPALSPDLTAEWAPSFP